MDFNQREQRDRLRHYHRMISRYGIDSLDVSELENVKAIIIENNAADPNIRMGPLAISMTRIVSDQLQKKNNNVDDTPNSSQSVEPQFQRAFENVPEIAQHLELFIQNKKSKAQNN